MSGALTGAGWPRPRFGGWPIPWVSPVDDLASMNEGRLAACASGAVCAVCGLSYEVGDEAIALVQADAGEVPAPGSDLTGGDVLPMDNAVMHPRCLRLALAWCPELAQIHRAGRLVGVQVPPNAGHVEIDPALDNDAPAPGPRGLFEGADCAVVALPPIGHRDRNPFGDGS